jgi:cell division protein FtsQ
MKRPEGFDAVPGSTTGATPPRKVEPRKVEPRKVEPRKVEPDTASQRKTPTPKPPPVEPTSSLTGATPSAASPRPRRPGRSPRSPASERPPDAAARHDLKRAEKARRSYERGEARRFTRRSRRRRVTWLVSVLSLLLVVGFVTGAVYSPLLSLKTIRVEGASRVSAASVRAAVDGQLGRPLALVDFNSITRALGKFPLIRSFVTETVPPDTLVIRIAERAPIATLATSSGFAVVDPAGIVIDSGAERQPGLPLIELGAAPKGSPAFAAAVGVLLALPTDLLKTVDTVTAQTSDDVTLTLTTGQSVVWGSPEQSALKAKVLAAVISVGGTTTKYDVSAPGHPVLGGN